MVPSWLRKTKVFNKFSKAMVNHLGLTLTKQDLQNVVDLMEPYGQISNGIEFLSPPLDVRNCHLHIMAIMMSKQGFALYIFSFVLSPSFFFHLFTSSCSLSFSLF